VQHFIATYGYLAIFVLMLAESACIPVPSELIMTFGGALAAGAVPGTHLSLIGVILAGTAGNVAGSYLAWAAGRYGGQPLLRRLSEGRLGRRLLREHDLDRAIAWFDRHGGKAVLIGRMLPVVRTFISLPAGIAENARAAVRHLHDHRLHPVDRGAGGGVRRGHQLGVDRERVPRAQLHHPRDRAGGYGARRVALCTAAPDRGAA
jgi:membrane protein YqaA with SNARE-associated domain